MKTNKSTYGNNLDYGLNANINTLVNKETISDIYSMAICKTRTNTFKGFKTKIFKVLMFQGLESLP